MTLDLSLSAGSSPNAAVTQSQRSRLSVEKCNKMAKNRFYL
jgi:hypothetical protein